MTSSTFSGLGGGANHSLRDVGKAEPRAEVYRPIASQGINVNMRSLFELPVTQNPHSTCNDHSLSAWPALGMFKVFGRRGPLILGGRHFGP